jgi:excisionase family DNA binding protein
MSEQAKQVIGLPVASSSGMRIPERLWRELESLAFFSAPDAARILNCDERTIRRAAAAGTIPATKVGAKWLIPTVWLRQQVNPPDLAA